MRPMYLGSVQTRPVEISTTEHLASEPMNRSRGDRTCGRGQPDSYLSGFHTGKENQTKTIRGVQR